MSQIERLRKVVEYGTAIERLGYTITSVAEKTTRKPKTKPKSKKPLYTKTPYQAEKMAEQICRLCGRKIGFKSFHPDPQDPTKLVHDICLKR